MTNNQRNPKTTRPRQYPTMTDGSSGFLELALSGGRKKCLYLLLLALMLLIVLNLALTLWILKVMEFSAVGLYYYRDKHPSSSKSFHHSITATSKHIWATNGRLIRLNLFPGRHGPSEGGPGWAAVVRTGGRYGSATCFHHPVTARTTHRHRIGTKSHNQHSGWTRPSD